MILANPVLFAWLLIVITITLIAGLYAIRAALREDPIRLMDYLPPAEWIVMTIFVTAMAVGYAATDPPTQPRLFFVSWIYGGFSVTMIACMITSYRHQAIVAGLRRRNLSLIRRLVDKGALEHAAEYEDTDEP